MAGGRGNYQQRNQNIQVEIPSDYLRDGYFNRSNQGKYIIKRELLVETAQTLANVFSDGKLETTQLRRFYNYVVNINERMKLLGDDFERVKPDILRLIPLARYARNRGNVPDTFYTFIEKNVNAIKTKEDFIKGFIEHFEAVVAFSRQRR